MPESPDRSALFDCIEHGAWEAAVALAQLRYAERRDAECLGDLARCLLAKGDPAAAALLLAQESAPQTARLAFLTAKAAFALGRLGEAEVALRGLFRSESAPATATAAHAHALLGDVLARTHRLAAAREEWSKAAQLNPYLWPALASLAETAEKVTTTATATAPTPGLDAFFRRLPDQSSQSQPVAATARNLRFATPALLPKPPPPRAQLSPSSGASPALTALAVETPMETTDSPPSNTTPAHHTSSADSPPLAPQQQPLRAPRKARKLANSTNSLSSSARRSTRHASARILSDENTSAPPEPIQPTRRSPRLSSSNNENASASRHVSHRPPGLRSNNPRHNSNQPRAPVSPQPEADVEAKEEAKEAKPPLPPPLEAKKGRRGAGEEAWIGGAKEEEPQRPLLQALARLAPLYQELGQSHWETGLQLVEDLSSELRSTPLALLAEARCHFELAEYAHAVRIFQELERRHPWHPGGLALHSTALWHQQDGPALSALAATALRHFRHRPEAWCVLGNSFSLHKDHERAVRFLQRAVALQPLPYAYTLLGHELLALDKLAKASAAFRTAAALAPHHYNAYFGLGEAAKRSEQFPLARVYFRKALALNPRNPILQCQLAEMEAGLGAASVALKLLSKSDHPASRFHRAQLLLSAGRAEAALKELEILKAQTPREARVFFLSGKALQRLGKQHLSLIDYIWASDLEPRGEGRKAGGPHFRARALLPDEDDDAEAAAQPFRVADGEPADQSY